MKVMQKPTPPDMETKRYAAIVVDCVFAVRSATGAGLPKSVYEKCLAREIAERLKICQQVILPLKYRGHRIDDVLRIDLLVEDRIITEVKAAKNMVPVFKTRPITYLKPGKLRLGFFVNFNKIPMKVGIEHVIV